MLAPLLLWHVFAPVPPAQVGKAASPREPANLISNGDFESGLHGWSPFWARVPSSGRVTVDRSLSHAGKASIRIEHTGASDWSFAPEETISVRPGEVFRFSAWLRLEGKGRAEISMTLRDDAGQVLDWSYGARSTGATDGWRHLSTRFMIPPHARSMLPRVVGDGAANVHVDGVVLVREPETIQVETRKVPGSVQATRGALQVVLETARGSLRVVDRRTGQTWVQRPGRPELWVRDAKLRDGDIEARVVDPQSVWEFSIRLRLESERPELVVELSGEGPLARPLAFPYPFQSGKGTFLVMPVNEGMSYPVDDSSLPEMQYILYGGHGLCMPWWGVTDGEHGMMAIVETADDASVRVPRLDGRLCLAPLWDPQKGLFGPIRRIRYIFLDRGGYVAMAKRYREHAKATGLLKTLEQKRAENPNVDRLIGAVNVWCWDHDAVGIVRELQQAGIERILWSNGVSAEQIKQLNSLGVLTSRYDIYQDVMDPAAFSRLRYTHPDWPTKAWPADLMIDGNGRWIRGWEIEGKDGGMYPCGVTCDRQAMPYAEERIGEDLKTKPYLCRFIDTTTASPWRECYAPAHPLTRSESRHWKMELLRTVSERFKLVAGSETGHEAAVPFVHYFEGMLSLGPYRVDDAGREMQRILTQVPPQIDRFQTGPYYRLPLWELVYHDCVVAQWYWGDYNNKLPAVWDRRDLYNALYGTPPMFMFTRRLWKANRERFVKSYQTVCPIARRVGYDEMLSHRWLTRDHTVQQTKFANGVTVTVNLGKNEFAMPDRSKLAPMGLKLGGKDKDSLTHGDQ
jgi:hypothetical protein